MKRFTLLALLCFGAGAAAEAASLAIDRQPEQGGMVIGRTDPGCILYMDGLQMRVAADGHFILGFRPDHVPWAMLRVMCADSTQRRQSLFIAERAYEEQRIDGLPPDMVAPDEALLARIREDAAKVEAARETDSDLEGWRQALQWPVSGVITGVYGARRILDGEPAKPHYGVDIAAEAGTDVRATADGRVSLAESLFLSGGTVIIDHGFGLSSSYLHLAEISVRPGAAIRQGAVIGTVGATGRATGAHLDWRLNWYRTRLDPERAAGPMPPP